MDFVFADQVMDHVGPGMVIRSSLTLDHRNRIIVSLIRTCPCNKSIIRYFKS